MTWRPHNTNGCPTDRNATVRVRFRNGKVSKDELPASSWRWTHTGGDFDIAAYEVTSVEGVE